jgi:hypothetical protein
MVVLYSLRVYEVRRREDSPEAAGGTVGGMLARLVGVKERTGGVIVIVWMFVVAVYVSTGIMLNETIMVVKAIYLGYNKKQPSRSETCKETS